MIGLWVNFQRENISIRGNDSQTGFLIFTGHFIVTFRLYIFVILLLFHIIQAKKILIRNSWVRIATFPQALVVKWSLMSCCVGKKDDIKSLPVSRRDIGRFSAQGIRCLLQVCWAALWRHTSCSEEELQPSHCQRPSLITLASDFKQKHIN